jgi:hypothetical protein
VSERTRGNDECKVTFKGPLKRNSVFQVSSCDRNILWQVHVAGCWKERERERGCGEVLEQDTGRGQPLSIHNSSEILRDDYVISLSFFFFITEYTQTLLHRYKGPQKPVGLGNKMLSDILQWESSLGVLKTSGSTWGGRCLSVTLRGSRSYRTQRGGGKNNIDNAVFCIPVHRPQ